MPSWVGNDQPMKMRETSRGRDKKLCVNNNMFLNKDRVSMPDIDSDFSPDVRDLVVEYCKKRYGVDSVANIVTKSYQKPKGAIRNTARVMGVERNKRDEYLVIADKIANLSPSAPGTNFDSCESILRDHFKVNPEDSEEEKGAIWQIPSCPD